MNKEKLLEKLHKHGNPRHPIQFRALPEDELTEEEKDEMVIEGKAITYDEKVKLFEFDGDAYYEVIEKGALDNADMTDVFLRYNHSHEFMVLARTRNETLHIYEKEDGLYIRATLAKTQQGRDLYELIKRADVDSMSFAFTEGEEDYDPETKTWHVRDIKKLWDVSVVDLPAYENTEVFARRRDELESHRAKLENLKLWKRKLKVVAEYNLKTLKGETKDG